LLALIKGVISKAVVTSNIIAIMNKKKKISGTLKGSSRHYDVLLGCISAAKTPWQTSSQPTIG
jgi:hypothetical protein